MWKPDESLDEFVVKPDADVISDPPREVLLRRTGEVEVLKPLTLAEIRARRSSRSFGAFRTPQPLWFRRFLTLGSAALVMIALVLVSAILVGINDPAEGLDVATVVTPNEELDQPEEPFTFEVYSPSTLAPAGREIDTIRSSPRRRPLRHVVHLAAIKRRVQPRPSLRVEQPKFIPTTLVIYAENGVINTRIEPWLQFSN
ncbi:MAG: hypothetical protein DMF63_05905 [Acidobacteria bacterium]|nr:MAG: hypothetical protein DMF63_05905 [Acidobacteriota bacterium]